MVLKPSYKELEQKIKELQGKESRYQALIENQIEMICCFQSDSTITFVNEAYCRFFNKNSEELIGHKILSLIPEDDRDRLFESVSNLNPNQPIVTHEHRVVAPKGEVRWHKWTYRAIFNEQNKLKEYQAVGWNITENKRVEEELRESEQVFRKMFEDSMDGMVLTDKTGKYIKVNKALSKILGYSQEELVTMDTSDITYPGDVNQHSDVAQQVFAGESEGFSIEKRYVHKNGDIVWSDTTVFPIRDAEGNFKFMVGRLRDITERKQAEKALQEREENFKALAENANVGILIAVKDGKHSYANRRTSEITGYSVSELLKMTIKDLAHPDEFEKINKRYKTIIAGKPFQRQYETMIIRKDGKEVPIEVASGMLTWHGQPADIVVIRDIADLNRARDALLNSEARLRALSDASFEAIFLSDNVVCLDQNQAAERMFGYTHAEAVGRHGTEWIAPEDREQVKNNMLSGYERPYEVTALRKDGTTFPCEIQARMLDYQGRPIRITALRDIAEHKKAEEALQQAHDKLEQRVKERTNELEIKTKRLEDVNTALNVMLKKRDADKLMIEERVLFNVKELIEPLIENLKKSGLDESQTGYVDTLETFLAEIVSPFSQALHTKFIKLTLSEIRVANLIKKGKTTKEIADLLDSTPRAIEFHRQNLRKKLGLSNRKAHLGSYLLSLLK